MQYRLTLAALSVAAALSSPASAQLRIVSYNMLDKPANLNDPTLSLVNTVFNAIATDTVNGIAKRPDLMILTEMTVNSPSNLATMLNNLYGVSSYTFTTPGVQGNSDRVAFVYDTATLNVISAPTAVAIGGDYPRPSIRIGVRPVGYTSAAADLYVYGMHAKASDTTDDEASRRDQIQDTRANVNSTLPAGANVMYAGDMNFYRASESGYQALLAAGNGAGFDPINRPGDWHDTASFAAVHTQATRTSQLADGGVNGGVDDRFDFEIVTAAMMDGEGLSYVGPTAVSGTTHSYRAFGNGGNSFNSAINNAANTSKPKAILDALHNLSDHLPVVADYQVPAIMGASVTSVVAPKVIRGTSTSLDVTIGNNAAVTSAFAADELDYALAVTQGAATVNRSGTIRATHADVVQTVTLDTATAGPKTAAVNVTSASQAVENGTFSQSLGYTVLAPAQPSLSLESEATVGLLNLGIVALGLEYTGSAAIFNLPDAGGFTAALDIDGATLNTSSVEEFSLVGPTSIPAIEAGTAGLLSVRFAPSFSGILNAELVVLTSDENILGAANRDTVIVGITARGAIAGDADLNNAVDFSDLLVLAQNYGLTTDATWFTGDFDRDSAVGFSDLLALSQNYASGPANFESDWALARALVPEPTSLLLAIPALTLLRRRRFQR